MRIAERAGEEVGAYALPNGSAFGFHECVDVKLDTLWNDTLPGDTAGNVHLLAGIYDPVLEDMVPHMEHFEVEKGGNSCVR